MQRDIRIAALQLEQLTDSLAVARICVEGNSTAEAQALGAALPMAPLWVWASVAAWPLAMAML